MKTQFLLTAPVFSMIFGLSLPLAAAGEISQGDVAIGRLIHVGVDRSASRAEIGTPGFRPGTVQTPVADGCRVLATVQGSSGYGKSPNWKPAAKASVLRQAAHMGATHVVWERFASMGTFNGTAFARAYSCQTNGLLTLASATPVPPL